MKKSIAIDMDGVIADIETQFIEWYERDYRVKMDRKDLLGHLEHDAFPDKSAVGKFVTTPGFFESLPVMAGAVEGVKKLMPDYEVFIVSAAMEYPLSLIEKYHWMQKYFPFISWKNIIFCGDKSVIHTDFLIDDHCKNLDFTKASPLMFTCFHNVNYHHHPRVDNWNEVLGYFEKIKKGG